MIHIPPLPRAPSRTDVADQARDEAEARLLFANREVARAERRIAQVVEAADRAVRDSEDAVRQAEQELAERDAHIAHLKDLLARTYSSTSWKASRPLRVAGRVAQRLRPGQAPAVAAPDGAAPAVAAEAALPAAEAPEADVLAVLRRLRGDPTVA